MILETFYYLYKSGLLLGISYLNINEEERYRDNLQELVKARANNLNTPQDNSNRINVSDEDKPFINDIV